VKITVWVCENCGSYYASSNAGNLHEQWNTHHEKQTFRRSRCPTPACAAEDIHRVPKTALIINPAQRRKVRKA